jgi:hypothetical protein
LHWWNDTAIDDRIDTTLQAFFNSPVPSTYFIRVQVTTPSGDYAICAERADFYRDSYQDFAFGTAPVSLTSQYWNQWSRRGGGPWEGPTTDPLVHEYSGATTTDNSYWRAEAADGVYLVYQPSLGGHREVTVEDHDVTLCEAVDCAFSVRLGPNREVVCGF